MNSEHDLINPLDGQSSLPSADEVYAQLRELQQNLRRETDKAARVREASRLAQSATNQPAAVSGRTTAGRATPRADEAYLVPTRERIELIDLAALDLSTSHPVREAGGMDDDGAGHWASLSHPAAPHVSPVPVRIGAGGLVDRGPSHLIGMHIGHAVAHGLHVLTHATSQPARQQQSGPKPLSFQKAASAVRQGWNLGKSIARAASSSSPASSGLGDAAGSALGGFGRAAGDALGTAADL